MGFFPPIYESIINTLVYLAIGVYFLTAENNEKRVHLLVIVGGFFALSYLFELDFFALQAFIAGWVILAGGQLIASKEVLLAMLLLVVILPASNPAFFVLTFLFYVIVLGGFILGAGKAIATKANSST